MPADDFFVRVEYTLRFTRNEVIQMVDESDPELDAIDLANNDPLVFAEKAEQVLADRLPDILDRALDEPEVDIA